MSSNVWPFLLMTSMWGFGSLQGHFIVLETTDGNKIRVDYNVFFKLCPSLAAQCDNDIIKVPISNAMLIELIALYPELNKVSFRRDIATALSVKSARQLKDLLLTAHRLGMNDLSQLVRFALFDLIQDKPEIAYNRTYWSNFPEKLIADVALVHSERSFYRQMAKRQILKQQKALSIIRHAYVYYRHRSQVYQSEKQYSEAVLKHKLRTRAQQQRHIHQKYETFCKKYHEKEHNNAVLKQQLRLRLRAQQQIEIHHRYKKFCKNYHQRQHDQRHITSPETFWAYFRKWKVNL